MLWRSGFPNTLTTAGLLDWTGRREGLYARRGLYCRSIVQFLPLRWVEPIIDMMKVVATILPCSVQVLLVRLIITPHTHSHLALVVLSTSCQTAEMVCLLGRLILAAPECRLRFLHYHSFAPSQKCSRCERRWCLCWYKFNYEINSFLLSNQQYIIFLSPSQFPRWVCVDGRWLLMCGLLYGRYTQAWGPRSSCCVIASVRHNCLWIMLIWFSLLVSGRFADWFCSGRSVVLSTSLLRAFAHHSSLNGPTICSMNNGKLLPMFLVVLRAIFPGTPPHMKPRVT